MYKYLIFIINLLYITYIIYIIYIIYILSLLLQYLLFCIINLNSISEITPEYKIEFDKKVKAFRNQHTMNVNNTYNSKIEIYIDRESLFSDAHGQIMNLRPSQLKQRLRINYIGEVGVDAGGLLR